MNQEQIDVRDDRQSRMLDKRITLVLCLLGILAIGFWAGSRYPALNEKLLMGGNTPISDLAFSSVVEIAPNEKPLWHIIYATANWTYTNRQGMTFGLLFGALSMTLLLLLKRRTFSGRFVNSILGALVGAPLGVCVNCAAPIAKAIYSAGARMETMLSAMVSSPTLNVVVLTMLFTLFPTYIAIIKIALTLAFILIGIPLLTWLLPVSETRVAVADSPSSSPGSFYAAAQLQEDSPSDLAGTWLQAALWVVRNFGRNLWFIVRTTVPLMLLAGFLGSVLVTFLPLNSLAQIVPAMGRGRTLVAMGGLALVGLFLPVPMAFDVIATATLWEVGLPVKYTIVLLFTLGIFSVYPFLIVWKAINPRMATSLTAMLVVLGIAGGVFGQRYFDWDLARQKQLIFETFANSKSLHGPKELRTGGTARRTEPIDELFASLRSSRLSAQPFIVKAAYGVSVERVPFRSAAGEDQSAPASGSLFTRVEGAALGLDEPYSFSVLNFEGPFTQFRGVASGDVHNDGWMDLLFTSDSGLSLYANREGKTFEFQSIDIPELEKFYVTNAALVDLNNDGWLDIFFSTFRHGNYVIYNREGQFTKDNLHRLPDVEHAIMTGAAAFGDVNHDGNLDIVLGSWVPPCRSFRECGDIPFNNVLLLNRNGRFELQHPFKNDPGRQTLSLLLSDINNDGKLDLIIGSEDRAPDIYYFGNGDGTFRRITRQDAIIPHSTATTMSVAAGDINNDLRQEIYLGQITESPQQARNSRPVSPQICDEIVQPRDKQSCREMMRVHSRMPSQTRNRDVFKCLATDTLDYREDCIALSLLLLAQGDGPHDLCNLFSPQWETFRFLCDLAYTEAPSGTKEKESGDDGSVPVIFNNNVLLAGTSGARFVDKAGEMGLRSAGFTWNAKFADLDNDEFMDLYVVNGWFSGTQRESHVFFHNQQGKKFVDQTKEAGLASFLPASAYTYVDLDNDGDLDIVAVPVAGPVLVYLNNSTMNRIAFELHDHIGNRSGIGSKINIYYGPRGSHHQMREIQSGGGFVSFDAPTAYFGLGGFEQVDHVEVLWSTGERSDIHGDFHAGSRYIISRQSTR